MTILLASHDPQIAAGSERLIRLRDGAVIDDIPLTAETPRHKTSSATSASSANQHTWYHQRTRLNRSYGQFGRRLRL